MDIKPTFNIEEANSIISLLEIEARKGGKQTDYFRNIIAKIQITDGYRKHFGIEVEPVKPGYHLTDIPRGTYGEISKILEEAAELKDAMEQGNKVMVLIELADMIGAIDGYLDNYYGDKMTIDNIITMAFTTKRAFESGHRQ